MGLRYERVEVVHVTEIRTSDLPPPAEGPALHTPSPPAVPSPLLQIMKEH